MTSVWGALAGGAVGTVVLTSGLRFFDVDGDGQYDLTGEFKAGEADPYRYERIR